MMHVFDFDKTLISRDSLFGFYKIVCSGRRSLRLKKFILLITAILYKLRICSNKRLKAVGIFLFLKGCEQKWLESQAENYASKIELNDLFYSVYSEIPKHEKYVLSAAPSVYLSKIFNGDNVAGTELNYRNDRVQNLACNMYGEEKANYLKSIGYNRIEALYTDSYADKPLMEMANRVYIVKNGQIVKEIIAG